MEASQVPQAAPVRAVHPGFYCPAAKLCVEVDGDIHDEQAERDAARTEILNAHGIRVIRFRNEEVIGDTRSVLRRIEAALKER
ncbi:MAG TPA: DUF559 domain-containing protein [Longimicrobium sp.]|jgi:leucyl-tRNA synthetase